MMRKSFLLVFYFSLFTLHCSLSIAQTPGLPATEVYVIDIQKTTNSNSFIPVGATTFSVVDGSKPINISNNKGYDNQPSFIEPLNSIAYVSSRNNGPTDVYLYNLDTKTTTQFTHNPEAEYSPKITPDGKYISVVKGAEQNLTRISLDGSQTEKLYTSPDSIGYYCWLNNNEIAAVVLTKPITLKLINLTSKTEKYLTDSIGRSLFTYKNGVVVCFTLHRGNSIALIDVNGNTKKWIDLPQGTEDFYITADGWLFSSNGSSIIYCNVATIDKGWKVLADLKPMGISKILRLAVNQQENKLAFVTEEK